jgi:5-methylcytosine-specific restriction endonuclease McrA
MVARGMIEKCNRCGFNSIKAILGVHHRDRDRKNNALSNLEVLCPNCHSTEHMKHTTHGFRE